MSLRLILTRILASEQLWTCFGHSHYLFWFPIQKFPLKNWLNAQCLETKKMEEYTLCIIVYFINELFI